MESFRYLFLCVQSIYGFQGASSDTFAQFETHFEPRGARVVRLEQNYRSTGNIVAASNAVIQVKLRLAR